MKKRNLFIGLTISLMILTIIIMKYLYIFTPFDYPKGNLEMYGYKWYDFKKPIDVECLSWYRDEQVIYVPQMNNDKETKYILNEFASLSHLENYTYEQYIADLPNDRGKEYRVNLRLVRHRDEGYAVGSILLPFSFFENDNKANIDGANFFIITQDFKEHIIRTYSNEFDLISK
ncbi:hypothetical protein [Vallitalea okinawensis]|uniref:hypothetical protein n=1 Tax=Vallitalea okinawensis TaxID=2078660 RepID=UPI000CFB3CD7|nr:hypothetical protein [Vallitalea okinawensis]